MRRLFLSLIFCLSLSGLHTFAQHANNVVDEVIWVVGDEAILKSDVEGMRRDPSWSQIKGNPYCVIPERLAIQKLFLHQAAIDSIEVTDQQVNGYVEDRINDWVMTAGSKEKLEEYMSMPISQIREELRDRYRGEMMVNRMREKLTEDVKVSPAEVRRYFKEMPEDSLPLIPTQVEVELIVQQPNIPEEEINRVKEELRGYGERVNNGMSFSTLAILYSEDKESAKQGGELGFMGRGELDPAFANVAFSLTDPKKVSKVVESEFGFHIIQLIDKRGEKGNFRHILRRPVAAQKDIDAALSRLDSIADDIRQEKFTFEDGATWISDDKDTKNNHGLMTNLQKRNSEGRMMQTSRFEMGELANVSPELARIVDGMEVGEISKPFKMTNNRSKTVCAIAKLKNRIKAHRASVTEDFQMLREIVLDKKKEELITNWIREKQKSTYVRINADWCDCEFEYPGWVKQ
ncbi:MAG: peptidylprolyl isomerase [Bacteroidaceae bacterium]|nr:peptidylprolyl isomerase [Bacteroidaceae bacterium]